MAVRILYPLAGDTVGGSHISTIEIIKSLDRARFEAVVLLHDVHGPLAAVLRKENVAFIDGGFFAYPPSVPSFLSNVFAGQKFLRENFIEIIHCDDGPLRYIWLYAAKLAKVKYLHVQRTLPEVNAEKKIAYRQMDCVISNSRVTQRSLPKLAKKTPQAVSYPPMKFEFTPEDKAANRAAIIKEFGFDEDVKLVGFVAQMHARKRPGLFIEAAGYLKNAAPGKHKFLMAGKFYGTIEGKLRDFVKERSLENDVVFMGFREDAQRIISAVDVLVATAQREAFGRTLVEAMGLGTPVVAYHDAGHAEIIKDGETGFLVKGSEPQVFASKIGEVLQDTDLVARITAAAFGDVRKRFSRAEALKVFHDAYEQLSGRT